MLISPPVQDVAVDLVGNLYHRALHRPQVLRVNHTNGLITSFAGTASWATAAMAARPPTRNSTRPRASPWTSPATSSCWIDSNNRVRKIDAATGIITTVAGGNPDLRLRRRRRSRHERLAVDFPKEVAVDVHGNLYIADTFNVDVRKVDAATGIIHAIAGQYPNPGYTGDGGPATNALLSGPYRVAVDVSGNLFILDGDTDHACPAH